jgi:hypothetical protein
MDLKDAVAALGGPTAAAAASGIGRTHIQYWLRVGAPEWRKPEVAKIVWIAKKATKAAGKKRAA